MQKTLRYYVSPVVALAAFAIGVGCVRAAEMVTALFAEPAVVAQQAAQENIGVTSTVNFKSFEPNNADPPVKGRVLACYDPNVLPIWQELKNDDEFKERLEHTTGVMNCSDMIYVKKIDLNRDGNEEVVACGKGPQLCSATGNCGFWILQNRGNRWRTILSGSDYAEYETLENQVQRMSTRGYSNILLKGHHSAAETSYRTYEFDGMRYIESRCMFEVPKSHRQGEGAWDMITCKEFEARSRSGR